MRKVGLPFRSSRGEGCCNFGEKLFAIHSGFCNDSFHAARKAFAILGGEILGCDDDDGYAGESGILGAEF